MVTKEVHVVHSTQSRTHQSSLPRLSHLSMVECCERAFSIMKYIKNDQRTCLTPLNGLHPSIVKIVLCFKPCRLR